MNFRRARTEEQRDQRRRAILDEAAAMLAEMPVATLSLNELSRRVGIAKSNVLRYFESREDVLLELLSSGLRKWVDALDLSPVASGAPAFERASALADTIAAGLAARPVLCDLISAQAAVLERNVSTEAVLRHKHSIIASVAILSQKIADYLPELDADDVYQSIATTLLLTAGVWPHHCPTEALLAAYANDPEIGAYHMAFTPFMTKTLSILFIGLLTKRVTGTNA